MASSIFVSESEAGTHNSGFAISMAHSQSGGVFANEKQDSYKVRFSKGDIIKCEIMPIADHILLATSSDRVIHIVRVGSDKAKVQEDDWSTISAKYKKCKVSTSHFHEFMENSFGYYPYSRDSAVSRARRDISRGLQYYNVSTCNCEHWVTWWVFGKAWSIQIGGTSSRCPIES